MVSKKKFIFQKIFCCDIEDNIIYTIYTKLCSIYKDIFHYFFFTVTCAAHFMYIHVHVVLDVPFSCICRDCCRWLS
jgi:hypothetical protein